MGEYLVLNFQAPMLSFGGLSVDNNNVTRRFPAASMITGLLGNALGYGHEDHQALDRLQGMIRFGSLADKPGKQFLDYQTVDLGQPFMRNPGWTTRGQVETRGGGSSSTGTHIRYRYYHADSSCTVALALDPPSGRAPSLKCLADALAEPERPLFIGRKNCLPSDLICRGIIEAENLPDALVKSLSVPGMSYGVHGGREKEKKFLAQLPADESPPGNDGRIVALCDRRDWLNQVHSGERLVWEGWLKRKSDDQ